MPGTRPGMATQRPQGSLQVPQHLRPDGDHSDEQRQRGERGGFLNDDFEHGFLREQKENIVQCLFQSQDPCCYD